MNANFICFALLISLSLTLATGVNSKNCQRRQAKIIIAVDNSKALNQQEFKRMRCDAYRTFNKINTGGNVSVTAISYAKYVNGHADRSSEIKNFSHRQEKPNLGIAFTEMTKLLGTTISNNNIKKIFIWYTSGQNLDDKNYNETLRSRFRNLRRPANGRVDMFSVSPKKKRNGKVNYGNALTGYHSNQFTLEQNKRMDKIVESLIVKKCYDCYQPTVDFVFMLDNSRSMDRYNVERKAFMEKIIDYFHVGSSPNQVRYAIVVYGQTVERTFGFGSNIDKADLKNKSGHYLGSLNEKNEKPLVAIDHIRHNKMGRKRMNAELIVIHLTDGVRQKLTTYKNDWQNIFTDTGAQLYTIGFDEPTRVFVGSNTNLYDEVKDFSEYFCMQGNFPE